MKNLKLNTYKKRLGNHGEDIATEHLRQQGFLIITRNWRYSRTGEVDIVAFNPNTQTLHLVEVKTRSSTTYGSAAEAITPRKQHQLTQLAENYYQHHLEHYPQYTIQNISQDALLVISKKNSSPELQWLQNAW